MRQFLFKMFVIFLLSPLKTVAKIDQDFDISQAVQQASLSTWKLNCGNIYGSSFSFKNPRLIATNFHVVENCLRNEELSDIRLIQNGEESNLKITSIRYLSVALDIAFLETDQDAPSYLTLQEVPSPSEDKLFVLGYSGGDFRFIKKIGPIKYFQDEQYFSVDQKETPGISGGPIVDSQGKVAGINKGFYRGLHKTYFVSRGIIQLQRALNDELGVNCRGANVKQCREEAMSYIHNQGLEGDISAQYELGKIYGRGYYGVEQDLETASYWLRQAAEQGHAPAQYLLSRVEQDSETASYWLRQAAEQGYAPAQYLLSRMEQDSETASHWLEQARQNGFIPTHLKCFFGLCFKMD